MRALALAFEVERYYAAVETVLTRILRTIDGELPSGGTWHLDLLYTALVAIPGGRPALLTQETIKELRELLKFRHLARHGYDEEPELAQMDVHAERVARAQTGLATSLDVARSLAARCLTLRRSAALHDAQAAFERTQPSHASGIAYSDEPRAPKIDERLDTRSSCASRRRCRSMTMARRLAGACGHPRWRPVARNRREAPVGHTGQSANQCYGSKRQNDEETHRSLREFADRDGLTLQAELARLVKRRKTEDYFDALEKGYAAMRPEDRAEEAAELALWECTLKDGLADEPPYDLTGLDA